jgi:hypothetical protein
MLANLKLEYCTVEGFTSMSSRDARVIIRIRTRICTTAAQCSKILKLPWTTTFSRMDPGGMSMVLPSVATMMTVPLSTMPLKSRISKRNKGGG